MAEDGWTAMLEALKRRIEEGFGKRCEHYSPLCATCIAYKAHDDLVFLAELDEDDESSA